MFQGNFTDKKAAGITLRPTTMNKGKTAQAQVPLVVTTVHKGVFFGYGTPTDEKTIKIDRARMCVYWPSETHGVLGLAAQGPKNGSKIR